MDPVKLQDFATAMVNLLGDRRAESEDVIRTLFDLFIEPVDLPGPDDVVDPIFRAGLAKFSGIGYDAGMAKLREMAGIVGRNDTDRNSRD